MKLFKKIFKPFKKDQYQELMKHAETCYENKRGLWLHTDKYLFRLDFENMRIELMSDRRPQKSK